MRIESIRAKNYRTLVDLSLVFNGNYCTISGRNNCGKSAVIQLIQNIFYRDTSRHFVRNKKPLNYKEDKTQWIKNDEPVEVEYKIILYAEDDSSLLKFIEMISGREISTKTTSLSIKIKHEKNGATTSLVSVNDESIDEQKSKEIINRLESSNVVFLHNSTSQADEYFFYGGKSFFNLQTVMSDEDERKLKKAYAGVHKSIEKLSKEHKENLTKLLGRLSDHYQVDFSNLESSYLGHVPFGINLKDKNVDVPLQDWGSGTQNRTQILMSILQANRIKTKEDPKVKITPIVIIEEPESFLHPSAQAEFGKVLRNISDELGIQIIVTTHSPYMLNQHNSIANILLSRKVKYGKYMETKQINISESKWMSPFADQLGVNNAEFNDLEEIFHTHKSRVVLVEGETDKEYLTHICKNQLCQNIISDTVEIVPYGGKDVLKNTLLLKFILSKFDKCFITYDLDASCDVKKSLDAIQLVANKDYCSIGIDEDGQKDIEGLLPKRVKSCVYGRETDLVAKVLGARDSSVKNKAKRELKKKLLEEFKKSNNYTRDELKGFNDLIKVINKNIEI